MQGLALESTGSHRHHSWASRRGFPRILVPVSRLLCHGSAIGKNARLPLHLVAHRSLDGSQRIHILRLCASPERFTAARTQRNVRITAQVASFHARFRNSERNDNLANRGNVGSRDLSHLRLSSEHGSRHNLDERHPGPVVVDQRILGTLNTSR